MRKRLLGIFLFLVLITSACGAKAPTGTTTPTLPEAYVVTMTKTPSVTQTPLTSSSPTFTPETPIPTNTADCKNSASFVTDVTVADNAAFTPGATFTKTWRVKNTGTCIWGPGYVLDFYSDEQMGASTTVPLSMTFPNQTVDVSVELTAPDSTGTHRGNFVIKNPAGLIMKIDNDSRLWVIISVSSAVAANVASATPGPGNIPVTGSGTSTGAGSGFATVTCTFAIDSAKITEAINALNAYRSQNGLPAYTVNAKLSQAAAAHANDMACNNLFYHTGSNGSTPTSRVAASGYSASSVTENVYGSYPPLTGQEIIDWWKNDKTDIRHNENLLSNTYAEVGIGYSFYNNFGYYVAVFAKP